MPLRRDPGFTFPPELTQLIQQQNTLMQLLVQNQNQGNNNNNPAPLPPPVDHLDRFLRLNPSVFSSSTEPIVADDWLRKTARELDHSRMHRCGEGEVCRTSTRRTRSIMVGEFHSHFPVDIVTWDQFQHAFRTAHVSAGAMAMTK